MQKYGTYPKERLDMRRQDIFTLGVNYWPRKKAMYWWKDFERAEVESEFAEIAALKLQVVRIFLLWEDFQPKSDRVSDRALSDLGTVLDVALLWVSRSCLPSSPVICRVSTGGRHGR